MLSVEFSGIKYSTVLCNLYHYPFSEFFSLSQTETLYPLNKSPLPLSAVPGNLYYTFHLCEFAYARYPI